jgi:hypothetical protein
VLLISIACDWKRFKWINSGFCQHRMVLVSSCHSAVEQFADSANEMPEPKGKPQSFAGFIAHRPLPKNLHAHDRLPRKRASVEQRQSRFRIAIHMGLNGIQANQIHIYYRTPDPI